MFSMSASNKSKFSGTVSSNTKDDALNQFGHWEDIAKQENYTDANSINSQQQKQSSFSHPVYSQLSRINGDINKMKEYELIQRLKSLKLDSRGSIIILRKRLKAFYRQQNLKTLSLPEKYSRQHYDYVCVIDFEATCEAKQNADYPHEIIEFPAVLVDTKTKTVVDEFHEYCNPTLNHQLSEFCTELTGITQEQVDKANKFPLVLEHFMKWTASHSLGSGKSFVIMTDGPWDMGKFLTMQCQLSEIPFPSFGKKWINIRKTYSNFYDTKRLSLVAMLELLGLKFEGKQHSGIDDARNIARIAIHMMKDGAIFRVNERLDWNDLAKKDKNPTSSVVVPVTGKEFYTEAEKAGNAAGNKKVDGAPSKEQKAEAAFKELREYLEQLGIDPATNGDEKTIVARRSHRSET